VRHFLKFPASGPIRRMTNIAMVIPFPAFENNLEYLRDGARELESNRADSARTLLSGLHQQLARVRRSSRHNKLAEFVKHAVQACERGDHEGAITVILMALCYFETACAA
jgi:hypothetical protein